MKPINREICGHFSAGNFAFCFPHFSDTIEWSIAGGDTMVGKENVVAFCDKMMVEIASSTLTNTNVIATDDDIAVEGFCNYHNAKNEACRVSFCDIYHFANDKLERITSYCIDQKAINLVAQ